jgi:hypothetical protein
MTILIRRRQLGDEAVYDGSDGTAPAGSVVYGAVVTIAFRTGASRSAGAGSR